MHACSFSCHQAQKLLDVNRLDRSMGRHGQGPPISLDKYAMTAAIVSPGDPMLTGNHLKIVNLPPHGVVFHSFPSQMNV
ncbi:hypothetical protein JKG47_20260 [Acidithiobacillus sp. MC6.1]|nr:hypothetical protein [Acidithiobacillus sp. MC6.1]